MAAVTWNPSDAGAGISFSNGNKTATATSAAAKSVRATVAGAGLVYWEATCTDTTGGIGLVDASASLSNYAGSDTHGFGYQPSTGNVLFNNATIANIGSTPSGGIIRCAYNRATKRLWIRTPTGSWNGSGAADPAAGTGGADCSGFSSDGYASASPIDNGCVVTVNFAGPFANAIPSGFGPYDPASPQALTPGVLSNAPTFFAPVAAAGAVALSPSLCSSTPTVFNPSVSAGGGSQTLAPPLFSNAASLHAPSVTPGALTLSPPRVSNGHLFPGSTATPGLVTLAPALAGGAAAFYAAMVSPRAIAVALPLLSNSPTLFALAVSVASGPRTLMPARIDNSAAVPAPTVSGGMQALLAGLVLNRSVIFLPAAANQDRPPGPGTYPLAVEGQASIIRRSLAGRALVTARAVVPGGHVAASLLKGRP